MTARKEALLLAVALLGSIWAHFLALSAVPLPEIGLSGAEYIPHIQRLHAQTLLESQGWQSLLSPLHTLRALDGHYGALLHILAGSLVILMPQPLSQGSEFMAATLLNLPALAIISLSTAAIGRHLKLGMMPAFIVLAMPGVFATTRHYYYDLPMVAMIMLSALCLLKSDGLKHLTPVFIAALATALALLFKWAALLYLTPLWAGCFVWGLKGTPAKRLLYSISLSLILLLALLGPIASKEDGSFAFQFSLVGNSVGAPGTSLVPNPLWIQSYLTSLLLDGLGPILGPFLIFLGLYNTLKRPRIVAPILLLGVLIPFILLFLSVPARNGRYLMPLLPFIALLASITGPRFNKALGGLLSSLALLQVLYVEGYVSPPSPEERLADVSRQEPWRAWWWTGKRLATASKYELHKSQLQAALNIAKGEEVALLDLSRDQMSPHAWEFFKLKEAPTYASLRALKPADLKSPDFHRSLPTLLVISMPPKPKPLAEALIDNQYDQVLQLPGLQGGTLSYLYRHQPSDTKDNKNQ